MSNKIFIVVLCASLCSSQHTKAQSFVFADQDRISVIGSSIAMNGGWFHFTHLFYSTRYPDKKLVFLNAGISGEVTDQILQRMNSDILLYKPTWCVLMIEENDLRPGLYMPEKQSEENINIQKSAAFQHWISNTTVIAENLINHKIKVILQTPTVYDQTMRSSTRNAFGINDTLQKCAEYLKVLGKKLNVPVVDSWSLLNQINQHIQQQDPGASIIGPDRTHVGEQGHFAVACNFLKMQGVKTFVSRIQLDFRSGKNKNENCIVDHVQKTKEELSFECLSESLPFAAPASVKPDSLLHFTDDFNADIVSVYHLPKGKYIFSIDTIIVDSFTESQLKKGINLSYYKNTPQFRQSTKVLELFEEYWKNERLLRSLKYVEYQHHRDISKAKNIEELNTMLPEIMEKYKASGDINYDFFYQMFRTYITHKPREAEFIKKSEQILDQISSINKPVKHLYSMKKIS